MKKYSLRDGSTGDTIDKINEVVGAGGGALDRFNMLTGKSYTANDIANAGQKIIGGTNNNAVTPPVNAAPPTDTNADLTKHAVPVAVGGATTLGLKYGLKKGWGMSLVGGVVTGGIAHYLNNKKETV